MRNQWRDEAPLLGMLGVDISTPVLLQCSPWNHGNLGTLARVTHILFLLSVIRAQLHDLSFSQGECQLPGLKSHL